MKKSHLVSAVWACVFTLGAVVNSHESLINVALTGTASQSSTHPPNGSITNVAENAIDGNTGGVGGTDLLAHTLNETTPWWRVDLDGAYEIDSIAIWNRTDCCPERLSNFTISVLNDSDGILWSDVFSGSAGTPTTFDLSTLSIIGSAVKVQLNGTNYLNIAEV